MEYCDIKILETFCLDLWENAFFIFFILLTENDGISTY